jgi:hypothetical protein
MSYANSINILRVWWIEMRQQRSRKFTYEILGCNSGQLKMWSDALKEIDAKYQIFYIDENRIRGFLYFAETRTVSSIHMLVQRNLGGIWNIQIAEHLPVYYATRFKEGECAFFEMGKIPRQGARSRNGTANRESDPPNKWENIYELLLKQNQMLLEENQKCKQPAIYNTTNIVENKTINIQLFLKEECKDAISLIDFVRGIHIEDEDLIYAKERGLANAILHIFERGLEQCDVKTRPLHCTDISRETMHVKENDGWVKDTGNRLSKAISTISNKKMQKLCEYLQRNPEYNNSSSPNYEENLRFIRNIICTEEEQGRTDKAVRKQLAKMVFMPKMVEV